MTDIVEGAFTLLRRVLCAAKGHEQILSFDHQRLSLRCIACGYETPGWILGEPHQVTPPARPCAEARHAA